MRRRKSGSCVEEPLLKKAEIYAYLGEIDQAEKQLIESDRIDLAIALHRKCGNWKKVLQLMKGTLGTTNDVRLDQAYLEMGDHCADLRQWKQAALQRGAAPAGQRSSQL
ncbi:hypothetical protein M514_26690 [Trichuris suis]|uniref:Tetratricopeptide repeat protein n=1 Tax=Trichuris suis TaxID=68888 RepID=A0A085MVA1_9BILA|nr:hypothetical protein M514_26690 [Trichuris suis]